MRLTRDDRLMRVEAGAVVDEFDLPGIGQVVARHSRTRTPDGGATWACVFTVVATGTSDLSVVHRLSAPTLAEGRRSVRHAVEFLAGRGIAPVRSEQSGVGGDRPDAGPSTDALPAGQIRVGSMHPSRRATDRGGSVGVRDTGARGTQFRPLVDSLPRTPTFEVPPVAPGDAAPSRDDLDPMPAPLS